MSKLCLYTNNNGWFMKIKYSNILICTHIIDLGNVSQCSKCNMKQGGRIVGKCNVVDVKYIFTNASVDVLLYATYYLKHSC